MPFVLIFNSIFVFLDSTGVVLPDSQLKIIHIHLGAASQLIRSFKKAVFAPFSLHSSQTSSDTYSEVTAIDLML